MAPTQNQKALEEAIRAILEQDYDAAGASRRGIGASLIASVVVAIVWWMTSNPRPDPWTGTDADRAHTAIKTEIRALNMNVASLSIEQREISVKLTELKQRFERLDASVRDHHEESERWKARIEEVERKASRALNRMGSPGAPIRTYPAMTQPGENGPLKDLGVDLQRR